MFAIKFLFYRTATGKKANSCKEHYIKRNVLLLVGKRLKLTSLILFYAFQGKNAIKLFSLSKLEGKFILKVMQKRYEFFRLLYEYGIIIMMY